MSAVTDASGERPAGRRRPIKIGLFGIIGAHNLGNDASVDIVVRWLHRVFPGVVLGFMGMGPRTLAERYDAAAEHLQWYDANRGRLPFSNSAFWKVLGRILDTFRVLRWVDRHDVVLVPGAGVLESTTPTRPWARHLSLVVLTAAARFVDVPVGLVGIGASEAVEPVSRWEVTHAVRWADYRSYRDDVSKRAMQIMGVEVGQDQVFSDMWFAVDPPARVPSTRPTVGIGVMNYRGGNADRARADQLHQAYIDAMVAFTAGVVNEGWQARLFVGDPEDVPVLEQIRDTVTSQHPETASSITRCDAASLVQLMERLADVDIVVASRYHNVLCAVRVGVPTLSVSYAAKSDLVMAQMGLSDFCHPAREMDPERMLAQFRELDRRRDELAPLIAAGNARCAASAEAQLEEIASFIRGAIATSPPDVAVHVEHHT
jgi:polysaccharide pyruvyl transferase WcaK-like protein